jgi:hypothetical protein
MPYGFCGLPLQPSSAPRWQHLQAKALFICNEPKASVLFFYFHQTANHFLHFEDFERIYAISLAR